MDPEAEVLKTELLADKARIEKAISTTKETHTPAQNASEASPPSPVNATWQKKNNADSKSAPASSGPTEEQKVFKVNDLVSAKYHGDKMFYPAYIVSIMGSSAAPIYTIKFKNYENEGHHTVQAHQVRAMGGQKRKADGTTTASETTNHNVPTPTARPGVISAAPNINTELANAIKQDPNKNADGTQQKHRAGKKQKIGKALETSKASWQTFQQKGASGKASKVINRESMFKTSDAPNARVGFTGSGQAMRKDAGRSRHIYTQEGDR